MRQLGGHDRFGHAHAGVDLLACQAEVDHSRLAAIVEQNVVRLEITVHQAGGMGRGQACTRFDVGGHDSLHRALLGVDPLPQRAAFEQLHRDEHPVVHVTHVVHGHHVGMGQTGQRLGLADEPLTGAFAQIAVRTQQLERDLALEFGVVGGVDHPRGTRTQPPPHLEAAQLQRVFGVGEQPLLHLSQHRLSIEWIAIAANRDQAIAPSVFGWRLHGIHDERSAS